MGEEKKVRIFWLDIAKGIGIFFIVWGHVLKTGQFRIYLYAFNVTLFFFLLGYTFKYSQSLKIYLKKRFVKTMIPYYIWSGISITIFLIMGKVVSTDYSEASTSLYKNLLGMLYGNSRTIYMKWNQPLWFIPCMNLTLIMVWLFEDIKVKKGTLDSVKFKGIISFIFLSIGLLMPQIIDIKFPFQFESAIFMVAFVELGMLSKEVKFVERICKSNFSLFYCIALLIIGIITIKLNGVAAVRTYHYGNYPILFCISASSLTLCMVMLSYKIQSNRILEKIGQVSLPILLMHKFPILFFQSVLPVTKKLLEKPDTLSGLGCSFIVSCITIVMCYVGVIVIRKIAPAVIGE